MRCRSAELCSILIALSSLAVTKPAAAGEASPVTPAYGPRRYAPPQLFPLGPKELPYQSGAPIPFGYHLEGQAQVNFLVSGLVMLLTSYSMSMALSSSRNVSDDEIAVVPFAGPFIAATTLRDRTTGPFASSDVSNFNRIGMIFVGVGEAVGGSLIAISFAAGDDKLVRDEPSLRVSVAPSMGPGFSGIGLTGSM